jgi:hypothetical protein
MTATEHPISMAVAFPTSNPDNEAVAHVDLGASLDDVPTWALTRSQSKSAWCYDCPRDFSSESPRLRIASAEIFSAFKLSRTLQRRQPFQRLRGQRMRWPPRHRPRALAGAAALPGSPGLPRYWTRHQSLRGGQGGGERLASCPSSMSRSTSPQRMAQPTTSIGIPSSIAIAATIFWWLRPWCYLRCTFASWLIQRASRTGSSPT